MERALLLTPSPAYVVDERLVQRNLGILKDVSERAGCKILLAQKAFSMFSLYPLLREGGLAGTAASGLYEARLGREEMGGEVHVFSPAYREEEFDAIAEIADHVVFNSFAQWRRFGPRAVAAGCSCGLRLNPECSTQEGHAIYDPCAPGSRLGVTAANFEPEALAGIEGFHFHTLCEQDSDALEKTLDALEETFGAYLGRVKWINFGGGHHITREGYDIERLIRLIARVRTRYGVEVYLEPGEAVVLNAGYLVCSVLDTLRNGVDIAILDASAACHMPDVLEMPYRPPLLGAGLPGERAFTYRLAGPTCLAGDVIGDYSFDAPLKAGHRLAFGDMALYTMVKNNTFNGMPLPAIAVIGEDGALRVVKRFDYEDFKGRLS